MRRQRLGPWRLALGDDGSECVPARFAPAPAREFAERGGGRALQCHRQIVPWAVGRSVRHDAARIVVEVIGRVPAVAGHVDTAAKSQAVVDHHDLVMVSRTGRRGGVEAGVDARMGHPAQHREQGRAAKQGAQRADVPAQQEDLQVGGTLDQPENEVAQGAWFAVQTGLAAGKLYAGVEIPANQHDPPMRLQHPEPRRGKVFGSVDYQRGPCGRRMAPRHDIDCRTFCRLHPAASALTRPQRSRAG